MTDHANTYPDLVNVEDWLNAKGYTGEAGACHAAMSLIRKQERRIAELDGVIKSGIEHLKATDDLITEYRARIAELEAALKPFSDAADHWIGPDEASIVGGPCTLGDLRAARAALEGK